MFAYHILQIKNQIFVGSCRLTSRYRSGHSKISGMQINVYQGVGLIAPGFEVDVCDSARFRSMPACCRRSLMLALDSIMTSQCTVACRPSQRQSKQRSTWRVRGHQCWENCLWNFSKFSTFSYWRHGFGHQKRGALSRWKVLVGVWIHWASILALMSAKIDGPSKFKDIDAWHEPLSSRSWPWPLRS